MNITALVPMKAHSERVPNKNIKDFAGKPLWQIIADVLIATSHISEILINTDSKIIYEEAPLYSKKIRVIRRPERLCGDFVSMNKIIEHDMNLSGGEHFLQTHSTNPLITRQNIEKAIEIYFENLEIHDSLFSVTRLQTRLYDKVGNPVNHDPAELIRTQDLKPIYEENSCLYIFSKESFLQSDKKRIGLKPILYEINKLEAVDIDTREDFDLAEYIYKMRNKR